MTPDSLVNDDWNRVIGRLGGAEALASGARTAKAFAWGRKVPDAVTWVKPGNDDRRGIRLKR